MTQTTMTIAMAAEEIVAMNKTALYRLAQMLEISGRSNMTKAQLVEAITPHCDPTKKVEIVEAPVPTEDDVYNSYEDVAYDPVEDYENNVIVKEKKETEVTGLYKALCKEYTEQSLPSKKGMKLFYKSKDKDIEDYLVLKRRLWGATAKLLTNPSKEKIQSTIDHIVKLGLITEYERTRTYTVVLVESLDNNTKKKLNGLYKSEDLNFHFFENKKQIKLVATSEKGMKDLTDLFPNICYKATRDQMNEMYRLSH